MTDLVEFLRARLDEDERAARRSLDAPADALRYSDVDEWSESLAWRFTEDRVLREVEAKRRIVATFAALDSHPNRLTYADMQQQWVALRAVIAALAMPYADHPDYREEWNLNLT